MSRAAKHPAFVAIGVGFLMAIRALFGWGPAWLEPTLWAVILVVFAFWLSRWIHRGIMGPALWMGIFLGFGSVVLPSILFSIYSRNNPTVVGDASAGSFFLVGLVAMIAYGVMLGALANLFAIAPRRAEERAMAEGKDVHRAP